MSVTIDAVSIDQLWTVTIDLAHRHKLTVYDAIYLECAIRQSASSCYARFGTSRRRHCRRRAATRTSNFTFSDGRSCVSKSLLILGMLCAAVACRSPTPITLSVDLTDAPRKILHATETMPVQPGPMTLVYPKWIPGEHMPVGPDRQPGRLRHHHANGQPVKWERDNVDMFAYHITVPAGVTKLDIKMDFLATAAAQGFSAGAPPAPTSRC